MSRVVSLLVVGPLVAVAGFDAATFAFLLITRLLVFAAQSV
jgi:hypothetical protein